MAQLPLPFPMFKPNGKRVICVVDRGRVRVRVLGDQSKRFVQFPQELRQVGRLYEVDDVVLAKGGKFWRVKGRPQPVGPLASAAVAPLVLR